MGLYSPVIPGCLMCATVVLAKQQREIKCGQIGGVVGKISTELSPPSRGSNNKSICLQCRRPGFNPWVGKIPWRWKWQPTPVFLPGKSHGQRSLAGYSPWGRKESNTTSDFTSLDVSRGETVTTLKET